MTHLPQLNFFLPISAVTFSAWFCRKWGFSGMHICCSGTFCTQVLWQVTLLKNTQLAPWIPYSPSNLLVIIGFPSTCWRRRWHPTPVLLPGKSHAWRSLVGCSPWGSEESDMTEWLHFHFSLSCIGEGNGQPTPVFLPGESQGLGSLVGCHLWGHTESDTTEAT